MKWEKFQVVGGADEYHQFSESLERLFVFGGWIVRQSFQTGASNNYGPHQSDAYSITFVPDPEHKWNIN